LPDLVKEWRSRDPRRRSKRDAKHFFIPVHEIRHSKYDLSINRYKEGAHPEQEFDHPKVILGRLRKLEEEILRSLVEIEEMVK
jgi:type I restriction enzyme M protein